MMIQRESVTYRSSHMGRQYRRICPTCVDTVRPFTPCFDARAKDRTHPASYYQPTFDVPEDHGTVCGIYILFRLIVTLLRRVIHQLLTRMEWLSLSHPP